MDLFKNDSYNFNKKVALKQSVTNCSRWYKLITKQEAFEYF